MWSISGPPTPLNTALMTPAPPISKKLMDWLRIMFKDQLPTTEVSPFELGRQVGRQDVIRKLQSEREKRTTV